MGWINDVLKRIADHNIAGAHGRTNLDGVTERDAAIETHRASAVHGAAQTPQTHGNAAHSPTFATTLDVSGHNNNDVHIQAQPPQAHSNTAHSGLTANLLSGLTPTKTLFTTNPGSDAQMVDDTTYGAITTPGAHNASPYDGELVYDLGSVKRVVAGLSVVGSLVSSFVVSLSKDNGTYEPAAQTVTGNARYVKFRMVGSGSGVSFSTIRCYCYALN